MQRSREQRKGIQMNSTRLAQWITAAALALCAASLQAQAVKSPEVLIKEVSSDVLDTVKADNSIRAGEVQKVIALVDAKVMPHVDFQRMTASAVGATGARPRPSSRSASRMNSRFCWCGPIPARWRR
jgi:phospholipid transport system substrate-binding protein